MTKYIEEVPDSDGWSRWIQPATEYKMACCDCGLVHDMRFRVSGGTRAQFKVRRNPRSTGQVRRHIKSGS